MPALNIQTDKVVTMTVMVPVALTLFVAEGDNGCEVTAVKDVGLTEPEEVMAAIDHAQEFETLDRLYQEACATEAAPR